ncbi:hypothetical protein [Ruegeria sp.]|uniref:alpha/beta hydrolase n=1 Tax=Ruegeria sp. TaxID=1879320 RepID=UPI002319B99E|nr:hypothetical protein [Ruegeria sp.]MDA7964120.1 hypothetical protein [Ruegeria sp.]
MRILVILLGLAVLLVVSGVWYWTHHKIYRFDNEPARAEGLNGIRRVLFQATDGTELRAFVADPAPDAPVLISFYGNFSGVIPSLQRLQPLMDAGIGIVMLEYRGSGDAPGTPSERALHADALALYDQLDDLLGRPVPTDRRFIHGYSLGVSPAVALASQRAAAGLVIEAGYDRLCRFQETRLRGFPMCRLMWAERHDVVERAGQIAMPVLMAHGARDTDVPQVWAEPLFNALPQPKRLVVFPEGTHTNLIAQGLDKQVLGFLADPTL